MNTLEPAPQFEADDAISKRAADYFERQRFWDWTETEQVELESWLAESFSHRAAYLRVKGAIAYAEHLAAIHPFEAVKTVSETRKVRAPRRFFIPLLLAASLAAIAAAGIPLANYLMQPPPGRSFSTDVGGRTLLKFADGTEVELNTDTAIRFRMSTTERTVWLDKGEAWFRVAHNAANPFAVIVGRHRVMDLGTEFLVRRGTGSVEVALLNGRASFATEGTPTAMLTPGDEAVATPVSVSVTRKTAQELADELAWRHGMLVFRNTRLADVVREFNRYNTTKLVIADPSIAGVKISTNLKATDYEGFLQLAEAALNLRADREGNEILISRRTREETRRAVHAHGSSEP